MDNDPLTPNPSSPPDAPFERAANVAEVIRSEEELRLTTRPVVRERVRLVKRVVTETVTRTVEVRREELHLERIPAQDEPALEDAAPTPGEEPQAARGSSARRRMGQALSSRLPSGAAERLATLPQRARQRLLGEPFADDAVELTLLEEEVVVTKRVVPRERVRLRKETITEQRAVSDDVRKERVEVLQEATPPTPLTDPDAGSSSI